MDLTLSPVSTVRYGSGAASGGNLLSSFKSTISFGPDAIRIVSNWPIKTKFYVEPLWERGTKVYINGPDQMTKMAAMPIYGKNLQKSSSPEPEVL